jgi:hypothetical protein
MRPKPGKPTHRRQPNWSKKELAILRKYPVADVARLTGRTVEAIYTRRKLEGVRENRPRFWSPQEDELVRTLSVDEAVRRTGRKRFNLLVRRRQLGMPPLKVPQLPPSRRKVHETIRITANAWTAEDDEILRTLPSGEAAKRLGRTIAALRDRRHFLRHPEQVRKSRRGLGAKLKRKSPNARRGKQTRKGA